MTGRHGRNTPEGKDDPQAATEEEATRTARVITGLGWRLLQHPEILEHPKVLGALRHLEDQVAEQLAYKDRNPGRHRSMADRTISQQISDASGDDLKPNPLAAITAEAFIESLWQYRAWSGNPPWRAMAERAGQAVVFSTMFNAMNGDALPKLHVVEAIIIGCGGGKDDLSSFANSWRRIALSQARDRTWISPSSEALEDVVEGIYAHLALSLSREER
jgi:hypothetical protein